MINFGPRKFRPLTRALTAGAERGGSAAHSAPSESKAARQASGRPPVVVEVCSRYAHIETFEGSASLGVQRVRRLELGYAGNPRYAPASVLVSALARQAEARKARPEIQERFLDLDEASFDALEPQFFEVLTRSFEPPSPHESERLYSGFRSLETAQRALVGLPPMFVTHDLEEAHRYSNARSVVLCLCARQGAHRSYDNAYGAAEYRSGREALADGVRIIGVLRGQGEWKNPSALGGTAYD